MLSNRRSTMASVPVVPKQPPAYQVSTVPVPPMPMSFADPSSEPHCKAPSILTCTTDSLPSGYRMVSVAGAIHGMSTTAPLADSSSSGGGNNKNARQLLKTMCGGSSTNNSHVCSHEARDLTHLLYSARERAMDRMTADCVRRGANAVVGLAWSEREILGAVHVSVSGTAVCVEKEGGVK